MTKCYNSQQYRIAVLPWITSPSCQEVELNALVDKWNNKPVLRTLDSNQQFIEVSNFVFMYMKSQDLSQILTVANAIEDNSIANQKTWTKTAGAAFKIEWQFPEPISYTGLRLANHARLKFNDRVPRAVFSIAYDEFIESQVSWARTCTVGVFCDVIMYK